MVDFIEKFNKYYSEKFTCSEFTKVTDFVKIQCKCCGYSFQKLAYTIMRKNKKFLCPICDGKYRLTEELITYKLKYLFRGKYSLEGTYSKLSRKVKLRCNNCGNIWNCSVSLLFCKTRNSGCPYCAKNQVLSTSEFIKKLKKKYGHKYRLLGEYISSRTKMKFYCRKHKHCFYCSGNVILRKATKYPCPECLKNPYESAVAEFLTEKKIIFEQQKIFPDCKYKQALRFDFYIPKQKALQQDLLLELHGIQHYVPVKYYKNGDFQISQVRDTIKENYAKSHGYLFVVASDCSFRKENHWTLADLYKFLEKI